MARQAKFNPEIANKAFPRHLRELIEDAEPGTQQKLSEYLGVSSQAISYYKSGSSSPDWECIVKIAEFFNVSIDWLLGATNEDVRTTDITTRQISEVIGLSDETIAYLSDIYASDKFARSEISKLNVKKPKIIYQSPINAIDSILNSNSWREIVSSYLQLMRSDAEWLDEKCNIVNSIDKSEFARSKLRIDLEKELSLKSTQIYANILKYETAMRNLLRETTDCYETAQRCDELYKQILDIWLSCLREEKNNGES